MGVVINEYVYTVKEGDSLSKIAAHLWTDAVYWMNRVTIGADPGHIEAGQVLNVPGLEGETLHVKVESGDTLSELVAAWMWPQLYVANHAHVGVDPDLIHPGLVLDVPNVDFISR